MTASANAGFTFTNWTENGTVVSTQTQYTFTVTGNRTLVANFQAQPQNYTISVSANPTNGGTVTGGGTYQQGQSCTVRATANAGYTFINWTENGNVVSTQAQYSFTVTGNRTLVANFTQQQFTITAIAEPGDHAGNVEGGGTYTYGQSCTLTATPCTPPFIFVNWTKNGLVVSTNNTYTFTVTESATYVAHFVVETFTITTTANPTEGGTLTGGGTYEFGEIVTLNATPNEGYDFVSWTENGMVVSAEPSYTFGVGGSHDFVANFETQTFDVKVSIEPANAATVTGEGNYNYGDEVTLTLDRNEDYRFLNWTEDGEVVSEEMTYVFTITSDRTLVANFEYTEGIGEQAANVSLYPNPTQGEVTVEGESLQTVRIVNVYGQTVYNAEVEGDQVRIDLSGMAKGIYVMHIGTANGEAVRQIVVE